MSLKSNLQKQGVESEMLDEVVQDAAYQLASNANNDGMESQIEFLTVVCGWSDEQVVAVLSEKNVNCDQSC